LTGEYQQPVFEGLDRRVTEMVRMPSRAASNKFDEPSIGARFQYTPTPSPTVTIDQEEFFLQKLTSLNRKIELFQNLFTKEPRKENLS
jgi:hypothetical protein